MKITGLLTAFAFIGLLFISGCKGEESAPPVNLPEVKTPDTRAGGKAGGAIPDFSLDR